MGSSTISRLRVADESLRDPEALPHAAGESGEPLAAVLPQVHAVQHLVDHFLALFPVGDAFQKRNLVEHLFGIHPRIHAEILGQVAQHLANLVLGAKHIEAVHVDGAGIGFLQGGDGAHQRGFAGAIRAEQPVKAQRDREVHIVEGANAAFIDLVEACNPKLHGKSILQAGAPPRIRWRRIADTRPAVRSTPPRNRHGKYPRLRYGKSNIRFRREDMSLGPAFTDQCWQSLEQAPVPAERMILNPKHVKH